MLTATPKMAKSDAFRTCIAILLFIQLGSGEDTEFLFDRFLQNIRRINPTRQLPVLKLGDELVPDSTVILHRIEQLVPGSLSAGLAPAAAARRRQAAPRLGPQAAGPALLSR